MATFPYVEPKLLDMPSYLPCISEANMYSFISYNGKKEAPQRSLEESAKDKSIPFLVIPANVFNEINYLTQKVDGEYAIFLPTEKICDAKPHFLARGLFMPGQRGDTGGVSLDSEDCQLYFKNLGLKHRNYTHLHSHGKLATFWSGIDDNQQFSMEDLGFMDDYRIYVVVNKEGNMLASLVLYKPLLVRIPMMVVCSYADQNFISLLGKDRKKELDKMIEEHMVKPVIQPVISSALPAKDTASIPASYVDDDSFKKFKFNFSDYLDDDDEIPVNPKTIVPAGGLGCFTSYLDYLAELYDDAPAEFEIKNTKEIKLLFKGFEAYPSIRKAVKYLYLCGYSDDCIMDVNNEVIDDVDAIRHYISLLRLIRSLFIKNEIKEIDLSYYEHYFGDIDIIATYVNAIREENKKSKDLDVFFGELTEYIVENFCLNM